ncbi:putative secreted protein [Methanocella conradii HZ254]|uniref:Secreted protein n=2 Tax=Methanocella TaxID=570266 RepID=H8I7H6_METCZ|nr:putative secreted protein [Methanocella conradii HZ254]
MTTAKTVANGAKNDAFSMSQDINGHKNPYFPELLALRYYYLQEFCLIMKRVVDIRYVLPAMLLILLLCSGLAAAQSVYSASDNGKTITMRAGDTFRVRLDENPTTGYSWNLTVGSGLQVVGDRYTPNATGLIGSGGHHEWTIMAVRMGTYKISGVYKRPREPLTGSERRFEMTVKVIGEPAVPSNFTFPSFGPIFGLMPRNFSMLLNMSDLFGHLPRFLGQ